MKLAAKVIYTFVLLLSLNCFANPTGDKDALIIIDMQPFFVTRGGNDTEEENSKKVKEILKIQKDAIKFAKEAKMPIIFLEYEGCKETNKELKKEVAGYENVKFFLKNADGMFSEYNTHRKELIEYLASKEVGNLIITGANGGACVEQSIEGSLSNNYNVIALNKGIADFNYKQFIYPYSHQYNFKPTCESCKFLEVDDLGAVAVELAAKNVRVKNKSTQSNDSKRSSVKSIPGFGEEKPANYGADAVTK
jgi:nicotinamidase-related amidase